MSGGEAASEDLRALLVTHNVCGVFDQMESALPFWVQELQALVREQSADFVALHMQEVGGSEWKKGNLRLDTFTQAFEAGFPEFWCSGLLCSNCTETPECFSALGCLYLVTSSPPRLASPPPRPASPLPRPAPAAAARTHEGHLRRPRRVPVRAGAPHSDAPCATVALWRPRG